MTDLKKELIEKIIIEYIPSGLMSKKELLKMFDNLGIPRVVEPRLGTIKFKNPISGKIQEIGYTKDEDETVVPF